jgi:hypothetical protein
MSDDSGRSTRNRGPPHLVVPHIIPTATRQRRTFFPNFTFSGTPTASPSSAGPWTSLVLAPENPATVIPVNQKQFREAQDPNS